MHFLKQRFTRIGTLGCIALALLGARVDAQPSPPDLRVNGSPTIETRAALLARAELQLSQGQTGAATETLERAALMAHAPDTEMALVRSYLQAGQYRRALAFCAHVAGAHADAPPAGALYAWLLRAGGQGAFAGRTLDETLARAPQDAVALGVRRAFTAPLPVAAGVLLEPPHRMAPHGVMQPSQAPLPATARVVASGVLVAGGALALVPASAVRSMPEDMLWVRNGLGQTSRAHIDSSLPVDASIVVLRLDAAIDAAGMPAPAPREPFAGSPGFTVEFAPSDNAEAAWPWLSQGFFAASQGGAGLRRLGIDLADGPHGGPVFDNAGRLAGIALQGPDREALMLPASRWQSLASAPAVPSSATSTSSVPPRATGADQVYENALRIAVQLISPHASP
ncbi:hypothetical protein QTI66_13155 [Variovorax sp. J22R133]|uniref:tetratricopeptide repeat protein n=1 Tax=Variovorax brevis TaxID=3053503 RepID=UPI002578F031|nr:hypothetical protein [Variovorax sp. J22R133]MDM0113100.1 hypothetical protein [Variovorax sp. J22R133]